MEYGAVAVQAHWRRYLAQMSYQFDVIDIIIVQSVARRWRTFCLLAAVRLQCWARTVIAQREFDERWALHDEHVRREDATRIQARWRCHRARTALVEYLAAVRLQSQLRYLIYRSATKIQASWRGFMSYEQ